MTSDLFLPESRREIERRLLTLLNAETDLLSARTAGSPRAAGDALESCVADHLEEVLGNRCRDYTRDFPRRALADIAFRDPLGLYYVVDVKTHRSGTRFSMPNLVSVERLARFYEDDSHRFCILLVAYSVEGIRVQVSEVTFVPIESLDWACLTLGALGSGQVQIASASRVIVRDGYPREAWMLEFCDRVLEFYPREKAKIDRRIKRFEALRRRWMK